MYSYAKEKSVGIVVTFFRHNLEVMGSTCGNKLDAYGGKVVYISSSSDPVKA